MSDPGRESSSAAAEDSFFDLLGETLQTLDRRVRGQFLSRFFKAFATIDISDGDSAALWDRILARHRELSDSAAGPVSLKAAIVDVLQSSNLLQVPVMVEYRELRRLQVNAGTDGLTGLYNRRLFEDYFARELSRAERSGTPLALVIIDLHRFKEVNDRYGHPVGDEALRRVAKAVRSTVRTSDFAFRIGGDEFAILLPQCDRDRCAALGRRLRAGYEAAVADLHLEVPLTIDYGIAVLPEDGRQQDALVSAADRRLYAMKASSHSPGEVTPVPVTEPAEVTTHAAPASGDDKRKWERISLAGTSAHLVWNETDPSSVPVVDVSYGGVGISVPGDEVLPPEFVAVLHIPTQLPVKVLLHQAYAHAVPGSGTRVGCVFLSGPSEQVN